MTEAIKISADHGIIFDLDGTLVQSEKVAVPAFAYAFEKLRQQGLYAGPTPSDQEMTAVIGMTNDKIWQQLLPDSTSDIRQLADSYLLEGELHYLDLGWGSLYPEVKETLADLAGKYTLFVASNGGPTYVNASLETCGISHLFKRVYTAQGYKTASKVDLVRLLLSREEVQSAVMVGDRRSDVQAGKKNGLYTIGCRFGFADTKELEGADVVIGHFAMLNEVVAKLEVEKA
ncbi:MAG: HAD family hydrolase [Bacillota bacterium]